MRCPESGDDMSPDGKNKWVCDFCMDCYELAGYDTERWSKPAGFLTQSVEVEVPVLRKTGSIFDRIRKENENKG